MKRLICILILLYSSFLPAKVIFDTLDGRHITMVSLGPKKIVINYWADWCQPCIDEIQALNRFYKANHQTVALFAVNFDQPSLAAQREAAKAYHIDYPSLATDPSKVLALGDINAVPATFILNQDGKVLKALYGPQTVESLSKALNL